jgi:hypothetical protein
MVGRVKPVGFKGKPLKSAAHHWWPRGLSELWADEQGQVTRASWDGKILRAPSAQFGAITNGHHIKLDGPWATSIEPLFDDADSALPSLVKKLESLSYDDGASAKINKRITPHDMSSEDRRLLGEGLASLLVRCPAYRNLLHLTTEHFWGRTGDQVRKHDDTLIAANIHQHYKQIVGSLERGGKIVVLRSGEREFIMGEGYLSTLIGYTVQLQYHCLVPLTPTLAVLAFALGRYWTDPPICTLGLNANEVRFVNDVTQIYSRDYVFYRKGAPILIDGFRAREFRTVQYHRFEWLDWLMEVVATYLPSRSAEGRS